MVHRTLPASDAPLKANAPRGGKRFRTPTILQMEATECGAAALAMILAYFGRWVPLETLRVACDISRDGSKASHILRAARQYGLVAKGYRADLKDVTKYPFPMIIFWNFNHFLVLEGLDRKRRRVWLNDPASGPRTVSLAEFDESFTGVCLAFGLTNDFKRGGQRPALINPLMRRLRGAYGALTYVLLATLLLVLPGLVIPVFSKIFVDAILIGDSTRWLTPLLIGMGLTAVLNGVVIWLQQIHLARLEMKLAIQSTAQFFWHVLRLPVTFFSQRYPGDLSQRVATHDQVASLLSGQVATHIVGFITLVFYVGVMWLYNPWLTVIGVGLALLNFVALHAVARQRADSSRRLVTDHGKLMATSLNGIQQIETLKATGSESDFFAKWAGLQAKYIHAQQELAVTTTLIAAVPLLLSALSTAVILGVGGLLVIDGALTIGGLVAFQALMVNVSRPIEGLVSLGGEIQTIKGSLARLDDVLHYPTDPRLADTDQVFAHALPSRRLPQKLRGHVELRDLVFGYSRSAPPLINGLNIIIEPGQRVALIGGSGSGKSTIARVIGGLYKPWSGQVLFDGLTSDDMPPSYFAHSVATVDQEIFLFAGTLYENISLWDSTMTEATVTHALRDACVLDVIESRPGRYDTPVTENGSNFSGGQRQRLEIARALATHPSVLILDEATSALDPLIEQRLDANLRRRGCTCIIVAHRLSTIRDCDEIIVLEQGRVAQRGRHETMVAVEGPYRRLIESGEA